MTNCSELALYSGVLGRRAPRLHEVVDKGDDGCFDVHNGLACVERGLQVGGAGDCG